MKSLFLTSAYLLLTLSTGCSSLDESSKKVINVKVTQTGYSPSEIVIPKNTESVTVRFERVTDHTCAREVVFEKQLINQKLPLKKPVKITFNTKDTDEIVYGCHMNKMHKGVIRKEK